jgi:hypothetical protein
MSPPVPTNAAITNHTHQGVAVQMGGGLLFVVGWMCGLPGTGCPFTHTPGPWPTQFGLNGRVGADGLGVGAVVVCAHAGEPTASRPMHSTIPATARITRAGYRGSGDLS